MSLIEFGTLVIELISKLLQFSNIDDKLIILSYPLRSRLCIIKEEQSLNNLLNDAVVSDCINLERIEEIVVEPNVKFGLCSNTPLYYTLVTLPPYVLPYKIVEVFLILLIGLILVNKF